MRAAGRVAASASLLSLSAVLASLPAPSPAFVVRPHLLAARTLASRLRPLCRAPVRTPSARQPLAMGATVKTEPLPGGAAADDTTGGAQDIWRSLAQSPAELRCGVTLVCGQSFRWRATGEAEWTGVIADQMVTVREDGPCVRLSAWRRQGAETAAKREEGAEPEEGAEAMERVRPDDALMAAAADYFGLATPLAPLYECWGQADPLWAQLASRFPGLRVLRQDPVECLFCFICSSNNNIARIALIIDRLSQTYGTYLGSHGGYSFYTFPSIEALAGADEDDLRALGTGYRAKFILQSAATVLENGGQAWLHRLRASETSHVEAREALTTLHGVGPKVADCVCLFALDKPGAIPVDTHVWQITVREMDASLSEAKSLTPTIYAQVGRLWRERYGTHAGWAHTILFAADLNKFKQLRKEALAPDSPNSQDDGAASAGKGKGKGKGKVSKAKDAGKPKAKVAAAGVPASKKRGKRDKDALPSDSPAHGAAERSEASAAGDHEPHTQGAAELFEALYGDSAAASPRFKPTPRKASKAARAGQAAAEDHEPDHRVSADDHQAHAMPSKTSKARRVVLGAGQAGGSETPSSQAGSGPVPKVPRTKASSSKRSKPSPPES